MTGLLKKIRSRGDVVLRAAMTFGGKVVGDLDDLHSTGSFLTSCLCKLPLAQGAANKQSVNIHCEKVSPRDRRTKRSEAQVIVTHY